MNVREYIIGITANHIDFFSFEETFTQERFKRFAELAIFFHYISKAPGAEAYDGYGAIKDRLCDKIALLSPDDIFKNFYTSYHIVMPYVFVRRLRQIETLEKCLDAVCDARFFSPEIPPHRQMEWDYMLYTAGRKNDLAPPPDGLLTHGLYLPYLDRDLAYALTHALFYATDFGFFGNKPERVEADRLAFRVSCLIARFSEARDVDVTLELAICFVALYPHMQNRQEADRLLDDILYIIDRLIVDTAFLSLSQAANDDINVALQQKYHTLFVLGILSSLFATYMAAGKIPENIGENILTKPGLDGYGPKASSERGAATMAAHRVIEALKRKNYSADLYNAYARRFGRCAMLEDEIRFYVDIFKRRNRDDILWNKEFDALGVPPDARAALREDCDRDLCGKTDF